MIPDILVIRIEKLGQIHQLFREHKNYELLIKNVADLYEKVEEIFKNIAIRYYMTTLDITSEWNCML